MSDQLVVAVVAYPDIAMKIQEELDNVVGRDRLPTFDDELSLPYLVAFIKEVTRCACFAVLSSPLLYQQLRIRWRPVVPLAIPHATSKGDFYAGYDIPEGAAVYGNIEYVITQSISRADSIPIDSATLTVHLSTTPPSSKTRRRSILRGSLNRTAR